MHEDQLELEPEVKPASPPPSAWDDIRARHPGKKLMRVIYHEIAAQQFREIADDDASIDILDGATVLDPALPMDENFEARQAEIIAEFDAAWAGAHKGPSLP